ncbi:MAG: thioredoxin-disulfide reductase [Candidatus Gottesmanbacteria bacterium]
MYDVVIIGSGPAGYTAAIYSSRALLNTAIVSGFIPGGQLTTTTEIDNFPGFPKGIMGPQLMSEMKAQAERFGTEMITDAVVSIEKDAQKGSFTIKTGNAVYQTKSIIIATGAQAKEFGIAGEEKYRGKGISYCATCDGFFFKDKSVIVVGGGDTAMEEATFLTKFATHVTIIHRREEFRASLIMLQRAKKDSKISFVTNTVIESFVGETVLTGVKLKNTVSGDITSMSVDGVFAAIGHTPATDFLSGVVTMDEKGYIKTNKGDDIQTATSTPGIFAAGDCVDSRYRQGVVAAGQGAMAAIDVERWLQEQK